jgi:SET domain-containing protein
MIKDSNWRPLPDFLTIKQSTIEGLGLFTTDQIKQGDDLGMTHVFDPRFHDNYLRLPLGAFVNHHEIPNCKAVFCEEDEKLGKVKHIRIVALNDIEKGSEITVKYVINKLDTPNWEHAYETTQ